MNHRALWQAVYDLWRVDPQQRQIYWRHEKDTGSSVASGTLAFVHDADGAACALFVCLSDGGAPRALSFPVDFGKRRPLVFFKQFSSA